LLIKEKMTINIYFIFCKKEKVWYNKYIFIKKERKKEIDRY